MQNAVKDHYRVLIVGAGAAGISVAARLCRAMDRPDVALVDPSTTHHYQPLWTLVGGGECSKEATERSQASLIPRGTTWVQDAVTTFDPGASDVFTHGFTVMPFSTAFFATRPAPSMTAGLDVFVHEVIAAITTSPWPRS